MAIVDTIALSPWPNATATATRAQAVARLREALGKPANAAAWPAVAAPADSVPDQIDHALHRLAGTVSRRVEGYAPNAPRSAKDEAVVRAVAYLDDLYGATRLLRVSGLSVREPDSAQSWFRHSGAMECLAPHRARSAGIVGDRE